MSTIPIMSTLLKFTLTAVIIVFVYGFVISNQDSLQNQLNTVKQDAIEKINPIAKEQRLISEVDELLSVAEKSTKDTLDVLSNIAKSNTLSPEFIKEIINTLTQQQESIDAAQTNIEQITKITDTKASKITSGVNHIEKIISDSFKNNDKVKSFTYTDESQNSYVCTLEE